MRSLVCAIVVRMQQSQIFLSQRLNNLNKHYVPGLYLESLWQIIGQP